MISWYIVKPKRIMQSPVSGVETLEEVKLYAKLKKCEFWLEKVHFLGHAVSQEGISVDHVKIEAIAKTHEYFKSTKLPRCGGILQKICGRIL